MREVIKEIRILEREIHGVESKLDSKITTSYWVIGVAAAILTALLAIIALKK